MNEDKPSWANELIGAVKGLDVRMGNLEVKLDSQDVRLGNLEKQAKITCDRLDTLQDTVKKMKESTDMIPDMFEMLEAAGKSNEIRYKETDNLDKRVTKLEDKINV